MALNVSVARSHETNKQTADNHMYFRSEQFATNGAHFWEADHYEWSTLRIGTSEGGFELLHVSTLISPVSPNGKQTGSNGQRIDARDSRNTTLALRCSSNEIDSEESDTLKCCTSDHNQSLAHCFGATLTSSTLYRTIRRDEVGGNNKKIHLLC